MAKYSQKRFFIGIVPPEEILNGLDRSVSLYKRESWAEHVKWVKPANLHLTLKFLGNVNTNNLDSLLSVIQAAISPIASFESEVTGLKIFPKPSRPSVISAGITGNTDLPGVVRIIEDVLENEGYPREKRAFRGHITLGRCKKSFPRAQKISDIIKSYSFTVNEIIIFSSILKPDGPEYFAENKIALS